MLSRMRGIALGSVLVAVALGAAACGGGGSSSGSGKSEVGMSDYFFQPGQVVGGAGKEITIELTNTGTVEHNFTLDQQNVSKDVEPGEEGEVTVTVPKSGTLTFYCKYHRARGMTGVLSSSTKPTSSTTTSSSSDY
jgi:plastocyanin